MIHATADIDENATISPTAQIWHLCHIRYGAEVGDNCVLGRGVYVGPGVHVGKNTKIQNYAQIHHPAILGDGVFVGPGAILTNDPRPRSTQPDGALAVRDDWTPQGVTVGNGASIGAGAIVLAGVSIGAWAMVGAGCVVTDDVLPYSLVVGVPGRRVGWVGRSGHRLTAVTTEIWECPTTGQRFAETNNFLTPIDSL